VNNILFVCWDGPNSSYMEGLFLSIFSKLNKTEGYTITFFQLSSSNNDQVEKRKKKLNDNNISYEHVKVYKGFPLGFIFSFCAAVFKIRKIIKKCTIDIVIPRSIIPAFLLLLTGLRKKKFQIIYDSDGFPHDERVDFQGWKPSGLPYQFYRLIEFLIVHKSNAIITRSKRAKATLIARAGSRFNGNKIFVLWNGRDEESFKMLPFNERMKIRENLGIKQNELVFLYSGSVGEKYLSSEMLHFFDYIKRSGAKSAIIILTSQIKDIQNLALKEHLSLETFMIKQVSQGEVPDYLNIADFGLFFCKNCFSTKAVFPTKLSEYLLTGLPAIISKGIGDCDEIAMDKKGIYLLSSYTNKAFENLMKWAENIMEFAPTIRSENHEFALKYLTAEQTKQIIIKAIEFSGKSR